MAAPPSSSAPKGKNQEEFYVRAITDYYGVAADELDLKEGSIYTIIQTTASGWWYAIDEDGIDGWVPSNYLDRVSDAEQLKLKAQHKKQAEEEAKKQAELAAKGAYDVDIDYDLDAMDDDDDPKGGVGNKMKLELMKKANNLKQRQDAKRAASSNPTDLNALHKLQELEEKRLKEKKAMAALNPYKNNAAKNKNKKTVSNQKNKNKKTGVKNTMWKSDDNNKSVSNQTKNKKNKKAKWKQDDDDKKAAARRPKMFEELTPDQIAAMDAYRPELKTIDLNGFPNISITNYSSKSYQQWTVIELLHYLIINCNSNNTFELKSIIGYLARKAQITSSICEDILIQNGLNIILNLLKCGGDGDVAISMSCCRVIAVLCEHPLAYKYPAEEYGVFYLTTAIRNSFRNPIFCYTSFNCICNFTHNNDIHRKYIICNNYNKSIIGYILEGMNKFRFSDNDVTQNHHCEKVQISACLALQNLAANSSGRELIGNDGIEAVLDGFIAHVENNLVISAALGTLINLCANVNNAIHFIENDGINYLLTYLQNPTDKNSDKIKITICRILRNIALELQTAEKLCQRDELDDVITSLLINADYATELFYEVVRFVTALITTLQAPSTSTFNSRKDLNILMINLCDRNLFNILVDALEMDYDIDLNNNLYISDINSQIAAVINSYILSPELHIRNKIFETADINDPELFIPTKLIQASFVTPSTLLTYYSNSIFFNCMDAQINNLIIKNILLKVGILDYLLENTNWYSSNDVNDNAIALGCGIILCYLQIWYQERQKYSINNSNAIKVNWDLKKYYPLISKFNDFIKNNKLKNTKSKQLKATQPKLQQFVKAIPVLIKKYGNI